MYLNNQVLSLHESKFIFEEEYRLTWVSSIITENYMKILNNSSYIIGYIWNKLHKEKEIELNPHTIISYGIH